MTRKYKTVSGGQAEIQTYVKRSNELWRHATEAFRDNDYDACAIIAIHSAISIADAACIACTGARSAGTSHDEAVQYFHDLGFRDDGFKKATRRFGQMVGEKSAAEYGGKNLTAKSARFIFENGQRFRDYLFKTLLKGYYKP